MVAGGALEATLLVWQKYGIHAFLVALLAVPMYVAFDRSRLEAEIRELAADRDRWRDTSRHWTTQYYEFHQRILIETRSDWRRCGSGGILEEELSEPR